MWHGGSHLLRHPQQIVTAGSADLAPCLPVRRDKVVLLEEPAVVGVDISDAQHQLLHKLQIVRGCPGTNRHHHQTSPEGGKNAS